MMIKGIEDSVCDHLALDKLDNWLDRFLNKIPDTPKAALLTGPIGCGKSTMAKVVLRHRGFDVVECDAADVRSQRSLKEILSRVMNDRNVGAALTTDAVERPLAIIMDDVESMNVTDKGGLSELVHTINPLRGKRSVKKSEKERVAGMWSIPIVCICSDLDDKRSIELMKDCAHIHITGIDKSKLLNQLCTAAANDFGRQLSPSVSKRLLEVADADIRYITNTFAEIIRGIRLDDLIGDNDIVRSNQNLYQAAESVLIDTLDVRSALTLYDNDRSLLPLMIMENYPQAFKQHPQCITSASKLVRSLSRADVIDKYIYMHQAWEMSDHVGIAGVYIPNVFLSTSFRRRPEEIKFTVNLSKTSLQFNNNRNIDAFLNDPARPGLSWEDLMTIVALVEHHSRVENGAVDDLLKHYKLTRDDIRRLKKTNRLQPII